MASLIEQYEQASQRSINLSSNIKNPKPELSSSGFINIKLEDEVPIFQKQRINFRPTSPSGCLAVSNNQLALVMLNKVLLRIDLTKRDPQPDEIDLMKISGEKYVNSKVGNVFMDYSGIHLIITIVTRDDNPVDTLYLTRHSRKPKSCSKIKNHVITAVAWSRNNQGNENTTGPLLLGTSKGLIYETELSSTDDRYVPSSFVSLEQYWKQVFDIGKGQSTPITGIEFHPIPGNDLRGFILVTTPSRLYQFIGTIGAMTDPPITQHLFSLYSENPERFLDIAHNLSYSQLQLYYPFNQELPKSLAWMTGAGIYSSGIDCSGQAGPDSITVNTKLLPFYKSQNREGKTEKPLGIVLTEFHVLILYLDRVEAICILTDEMVIEDTFTETYGSLIKIVKDPVAGTIWVCAEYAIYKYQVTKESRNVWQVYLKKKEYDLAIQHCGGNPANLDMILQNQALDCFENDRFEDSARIYAQTQASFEEITLKFIESNQIVALRSFLLQKINSLRAQDKTQIAMIVTWVVELFLQQLGELSDSHYQSSPKYLELQDLFHSFLKEDKVRECLDNIRGTIYDLITSHGNQSSLVYFTSLMRDFERVISFYIQNNKHREAIKILQKQNDPELFYKFSPALIQIIPTETVDAWIGQRRRLNPCKLIPAIVHYNNQTQSLSNKNETIRYLEFCVRTLDVQDQAIHNYLVSLYAQYQPDKLVPFLLSQGQDSSTIYCDLKYVLRVCAEHKQLRACVQVYTMMGLYEEAVELALNFDVELAKQNADRPDEDEELRKKLWLKIAHHVVKDQNDIKKCMDFLQECELLKIEDILPFFPDFTTIDHFKDAICHSLIDYNLHIESLKEEMEEATQSAEEIRSEIHTFRNKHATVQVQDKCSSCSFPILSRAFYIFPCRHMFHIDCLINEVRPHLSSTKQHYLEDLHKQLSLLSSREENGGLNNSSNAPGSSSISTQSPSEKIKSEIDDIVAMECVLCGDIIIRSIDLPFISANEYQDVMKAWE